MRNLDNMAHVRASKHGVNEDSTRKISSRSFVRVIKEVVHKMVRLFKGSVLMGGAGFSIAPLRILRFTNFDMELLAIVKARCEV